MVRWCYLPVEIIELKHIANLIIMNKTYLLRIYGSKVIRGIQFIKTTIFAYCKNKLYKLFIYITFHTSFCFCPKV